MKKYLYLTKKKDEEGAAEENERKKEKDHRSRDTTSPLRRIILNIGLWLPYYYCCIYDKPRVTRN